MVEREKEGERCKQRAEEDSPTGPGMRVLGITDGKRGKQAGRQGGSQAVGLGPQAHGGPRAMDFLCQNK